jgi:hypothetical protein
LALRVDQRDREFLFSIFGKRQSKRSDIVFLRQKIPIQATKESQKERDNTHTGCMTKESSMTAPKMFNGFVVLCKKKARQ